MPFVDARHRVCTGAANKHQGGLVPGPGAEGLWVFLPMSPIPRADRVHIRTHIPAGNRPPPPADSCSVFAKQTLRDAVGRENILLPSYLNIQSNNKLPQAIACSVLINSPFNGFQRSLPNTNAPSRTSVKPATIPHGAWSWEGSVWLTSGALFVVRSCNGTLWGAGSCRKERREVRGRREARTQP